MNAIFMDAEWAGSALDRAHRGIRAGVERRVGLLEFQGCCDQRQPRDNAVRIEAVRRTVRIVKIGRVARFFESERGELHARRVEALVLAAARMHAIKATDDEMIDHVDDRLGDRGVDRFETVNALLHQHFVHFEAFLDHRHLVAITNGSCVIPYSLYLVRMSVRISDT